LVGLARLREEQQRQRVGRALVAERVAASEEAARAAAVRAVPAGPGSFHLERALQRWGRDALATAQEGLAAAAAEVAVEVATWRVAHQHRDTLERLDDRLRHERYLQHRRREQAVSDELAGGRRGGDRR
jgi:hypothetical protein